MNDLSIPEGLARLSGQMASDAALLRASTDLFVQEADHDRDALRRFEDLATHLLPRVPARDRAFVAGALAPRIDCPPSVLRMLARDAIGIAGTILSRSPVLGSFDLLTTIAATGPEHHRLIAARAGLDDEVVRALRLAGDAEAGRLLDASPAAKRLEVSPSPVPDPEAPARPTRAAGVSLRAARDPWIFLGLDRTARLAILRDVATIPPAERPAGAAGPDRAFRSILGAARLAGMARKGDRPAMSKAIADSLDLPADLVICCVEDETGEPLAILLKALALDSAQAQQVMLLASPVGRDVDGFFRLCDLFAGMEQHVAATLVGAWRTEDPVRAPRHHPLYADTEERGRVVAAGRAERLPIPGRQAQNGS